MPPITVMKMTKAVQSFTLKAVRGDAQLLQKDQRADHGGAERGDDIDHELGAGDIDAVERAASSLSRMAVSARP
jgi:hypothetical protein